MVSISGDSIIGIIASVIALVILIGNAVYLNSVVQELQSSTSTSNLSRTGAEFFFWVDIILAIGLGIYLIYNIWRVFTSQEQRAAVTTYVTTSKAGAIPVVGRAKAPMQPGQVVLQPAAATVTARPMQHAVVVQPQPVPVTFHPATTATR